MTLANTYAGSVIVGLNRGKDNIANTIAAAQVAKSRMTNLLAIELGNEPEYWAGANQPIVVNNGGSWTPAEDAESQNEWGIRVGQALGKTSIIQYGNSNVAPPTWGAQELIVTMNATAESYAYDYSHHNYPGGSLTTLMSHANVVSNMNQFKADVAATVAVGKEYVLGETNSGRCSLSVFFHIGANEPSFWRWCSSSLSSFRSRSMDDGLRPPSIANQHQAYLLSSWNCRSLPILLVGTIYHWSSLLRRIHGCGYHGRRLLYLCT